MKVERFSRELENRHADVPPLFLAAKPIRLVELKEQSAACQERWGLRELARVGLHGLSALELVTALSALDGSVAAVLLLPGDVTEDAARQLMQKADCTHAISKDLATCVVLRESEKGHVKEGGPTSWLLATSGTTGEPKLITHRLASLSASLQRNPHLGRTYRWGLVYDPNRFAGLQVLLQALIGGSSLCVSDGAGFDATVQSLLLNNVNAISATPSFWRKLLMDGRVRSLDLKQVTLGGEIADQSILNALHETFPKARLVHIYASTEAGAAFAVRDGRAGFPASWLESAREPALRIDQQGHLLIKPKIAADGEEVRKRTDEHGYLDTEDLVEVRGDRVIFLGRASGAINVGGNKIMPETVEAVLLSHPEVIDARVFGKKSGLIGQLVAADIVAMKGRDTKVMRKELQALCREKLEIWQVPALIAFADVIEQNSTGKKVRK
jgi:acyl-CoA synthetase (AMP-forming)/AMP-acid ligase II